MCDCAIKNTKFDIHEIVEMADRSPIHDDVLLYTIGENFYLVPNINPTEVMVIDRVSGEATVQDYQQVNIPLPDDAYTPVCGFLGSIKLISGHYLVVAKYRALVGNLNGHDIFQLAGHDIIPYSRSTTHLTSKQIEDNGTYERMVRAALDTPGIYFSYSYDLTHTLQRLHSVAADFHKMSIVNRADPRFLWNGHILKDFTAHQYSRFALPIIQGFVSINRLLIEGEQITWAVVSRRSVQRAGTRLFMRGVDAQGNVANYVETEQIVEKGGEKASFVQTRGSIPLYWTQYPNIMYKPAMELSREEHLAAYTRHMRDQIQRYGSQVLLNLIDQKGPEQALEQGYRAAAFAAALPGVRYEPFDFHTECRGMRYDRLNVLIDRIHHEQTEFGYFLARGGTVLLRQTGVFRTNCVDCLDRTNVLQSMLARRQLDEALRRLVVMKGELPPYVQTKFNGVWADHADMISTQYSGTGALKTDFTRTGKRTKYGLIMDGVNSLTRYYKNNFTDGRRQDAIDLLLGRYVVAPDEGHTAPCPLRQPRDWRYVTFPSLLLVCVSMLCAGAVLPAQYNSKVLLFMMFWTACAGTTLKYIVRNGSEFVEWPRLDGGGAATARARAAATSL